MSSIVAVTVAALIAGCGSSGTGHTGSGPAAPSRPASPAASAATTVAALPAGQQGSRQQIPWAQVGPGWLLSEWAPTLNPSAPTSLFLIDPAGGRYLIDTFPANPTASAPTILVGWSGDGQRALLTSSSASPTVAVLNLRTLVTTQFELGANAGGLGFTSPDGLAITATVGIGAQAHVERFSLTGTVELSYPASLPNGAGAYGGSALYSPDGTELALGVTNGIVLMSNDGQSQRFLSVNPSVELCTPRHWWSSQDLLVGCVPNGSGSLQLWLVPVSGGKPAALTANPPAPGDLGDIDAWQLPSGTYVEDGGACGYVYVAKLQPSGLTASVAVPGVPSGDSTFIRGAQGDRLAIDAEPACHQGATLLWFAPATNSAIPILGGAVNGGTAENAILFGER